jgi:glycosyltransferase involved in cell wall biosynthesis
MAAQSLGLPSVWRVGTHFEHWVQPPLLSSFARVWHPRAIVCTSSAILGAVGRTIGAPGFVVHNGVDTERFSSARRIAPMRAELGIPEAAPVLAFVGRIAPEKGPELLVDAFANVASRLPELRLIVAGDSAWRSRLETALAARGLFGRARLLGFVRDVERVYATADVVVSTSQAEGCPNAVLEAMAMGRAVVATRVGGTAEIVRDGVDGRLVPRGDATACADAVMELVCDEAERRRLGSAAAARVAERFSLDGQVARLAAVIRWAVANRSGMAVADRDADAAVQQEPVARATAIAQADPVAQVAAALGPGAGGA